MHCLVTVGFVFMRIRVNGSRNRICLKIVKTPKAEIDKLVCYLLGLDVSICAYMEFDLLNHLLSIFKWLVWFEKKGCLLLQLCRKLRENIFSFLEKSNKYKSKLVLAILYPKGYETFAGIGDISGEHCEASRH